jgi:FKBP-type peptidyl-prolyl cis-trans isomerase
MRRFFPKRSTFVAMTALLAACNLDVAQPVNSPSDPATETFAPELKIDLSKMQKTTAGTYYMDVKPGTGLTLGVTASTNVIVSYVGFLKTGAPFAQALNQLVSLNTMPAGFGDGIAGMREGGERILVVPSALGYGAVPLPGVPPNSTLVFDIILNQVP